MEKIILNINDIFLDNQNPRLNTIYEQQEDSIKELLKLSEEKIYNLIVDISEKGLNPFENIGVTKEKNRYIVLEGNRRICALKILKNHELIKKINLNLYKKISKFKTNIDKIEVIYFQNREKANEWIKLLHTGENLGKGRVSWNTKNKRLFDLRNSRPLNTVEKFINTFNKKSTLSDEFLEKMGNLKLTNLERTISDPNIKEALGIEKIGNNKYNFDNINIDVADKLMFDMIARKPKVAEIYNKDNRKEYLEKILKIDIPKEVISTNLNNNREDIFKESQNTSQKESQNISQEDNKNKKNNISANEQINTELKVPLKKSNPHTATRKSLIPKKVILKIDDPKLNNLYIELKNCDINEFPTLIGCSFRIFLELSIDEYLSKCGLNFPKEKLEGKVIKCIEHLLKEGLITSSEEKNLKLMASSNVITSIKTQNSIVHTKLFFTAEILKNVWDNYEKMFEIIYDEINKKIMKKRNKI